MVFGMPLRRVGSDPLAGCSPRSWLEQEPWLEDCPLMKTFPVRLAVRRTVRSITALTVSLVLLVLAPFAVALDVHHELAAADADGHEHSETDLCQWVQHQTAGSLDVSPPKLPVIETGGLREFPAERVFLSIDLFPDGPSRAPPLR